ncbi:MULTISPECIES: ATP-dependent DNA helicase [unclassified Nocardioides]|uniref:ATP-dependent DNA helicase n=1 Tax=unclassified Nocardioides TaxID=2615069 RepID=UPI0009F0CE2B|nr:MULTISPECIES: ATP-dependent DNA helicase [unclassified Nocardioides]GAW49576.1 UvrD/REP helicase [Nocardioides sp. PD653-B2]GAW57310.1 UvrD/REP helicase [Nocardioides sp. PD653]
MTTVSIEAPDDLARVMKTPYAPSDQQWAAISAPLSPAVVIAGAGSGKTTLMAARVVYLVVTGQVRPDEVLGLTFTTKAASELRHRIRTALRTAGALEEVDEGEDVLEPTVLTYNAYAAGLLTDHGLRIGHEPDTRVITDAARYQLGARAVDRFTGDVRHLTDHPATAIQNLLALDSAMSEHLVSPDDVRALDTDARVQFERALAEEVAGKNRTTYREGPEKAIFAINRRGELLGLVEAYRRLKRDLGLMDFSDQIELGARLASEQPDVGALERSRFKVVLLDEYQDTSVAQATMLSRLFGGGHAVTAVGDPNQAIYGWRGASVSNILNFADTFPSQAGPVPVYPLTVNRRSDARILEVANRLAAPLYDRYGQVEPLVAKPEADAGSVALRVFETHGDELDALVEAVTAAHGARPDPGGWAKIGVLTRDNAHAEDVFDALTGAGIPVEIVGLSGLLRLPEVAEIVATLHLLHDVTANASLLTLLTGPRWAIGPRDLRLLSRRATEIAGRQGRGGDSATITEHLLDIADGIDPAEIPSLDDALADPGDAPYSAEARERFALLASELRMLRTTVGEPLLDIVRRIIDTSGTDVELASAVSPAATARRDNLDLFVKAVAEFQAVDGDVTLPALLAYLTAEDDQGNGLDIATPTEADSVKLLTVHRSKGLEWDSVFLVGVCETRFPSNRSRTLWTSSPSILPAPLRGDAPDLPQLHGWDKAALDAYRADTRAHDAEEELRLGYVAFTRAAHHLSVTSYLWSPRATPFGPSPYQETVRDQLLAWGEPVDGWLDKPQKGDPNPYAAVDPSRPWPPTGTGREAALRIEAARRVREIDAAGQDHGLDMIESARVGDWDAELDRLLTEARRDRSSDIAVPLPSSLSATALGRLHADPETFARELARPMPRPPSSAARFGTRFHAWVEARFDQQDLFDYGDLPGRADAGIDDDTDLEDLIATFEAGPFATRTPHQVEAPFALVLAGQVVRGRIDAVYAEDGGYLLVDWKTNRGATADPLQLGIYRLAWAELHDVPLESVRAAFYYVRTGDLVEPPDLPDRQALEAILDPS